MGCSGVNDFQRFLCFEDASMLIGKYRIHGAQRRQWSMGWDIWDAAKPKYYGVGRSEVSILQDGMHGTQRRQGTIG